MKMWNCNTDSSMWLVKLLTAACVLTIVCTDFVECSRCKQAARRAVCNVQPNPGSSQLVSGVVTFFQENEYADLAIEVTLIGFNSLPLTADDSAFLHGFHVHETGNTTGGCGSTGGHYNPEGVNHGGPTDKVRHAGDFGNLRQTFDGHLDTAFIDSKATLFGKHSIIGRAIVVHAGEDDLGRGGNAASLANGNAGARLACCVIGWA